MDQWEKSIREKVHAADILTDGEWVYLVGLFGMASDHADCGGPPEIERLTKLNTRIVDQGLEQASDNEQLRAALLAANEPLPSVNWKDGKPYSYCPECGRIGAADQQEGDGK